MNDTEDPAVTRARHGRFHYRTQAKRDRHADAQAKHRAKLHRNRAPSRADIAAAALGVLLLVCKTYPHDKQVQTMRAMIENELAEAGFGKDQIKSRLDRMIDNCDRDRVRSREYRAWFEQRRQHPKPP
jgi:hypothetical protein